MEYWTSHPVLCSSLSHNHVHVLLNTRAYTTGREYMYVPTSDDLSFNIPLIGSALHLESFKLSFPLYRISGWLRFWKRTLVKRVAWDRIRTCANSKQALISELCLITHDDCIAKNSLVRYCFDTGVPETHYSNTVLILYPKQQLLSFCCDVALC